MKYTIMKDLPNLSHFEGFDWDQANIQKNWDRHKVAFYECEEVFFRDPVIVPDSGHSVTESRYFALGRTIRGRRLTIIFTLRKKKIRVISARDMSRKERAFYGKAEKDS